MSKLLGFSVSETLAMGVVNPRCVTRHAVTTGKPVLSWKIGGSDHILDAFVEKGFLCGRMNLGDTASFQPVFRFDGERFEFPDGEQWSDYGSHRQANLGVWDLLRTHLVKSMMVKVCQVAPETWHSLSEGPMRELVQEIRESFAAAMVMST